MYSSIFQYYCVENSVVFLKGIQTFRRRLNAVQERDDSKLVTGVERL